MAEAFLVVAPADPRHRAGGGRPQLHAGAHSFRIEPGPSGLGAAACRTMAAMGDRRRPCHGDFGHGDFGHGDFGHGDFGPGDGPGDGPGPGDGSGDAAVACRGTATIAGAPPKTPIASEPRTKAAEPVVVVTHVKLVLPATAAWMTHPWPAAMLVPHLGGGGGAWGAGPAGRS